MCAVKFVNSFTRRQHLFNIESGSTLQWSAEEVTGHHKAQVPDDVDSNLSPYPAPLTLFQFHPKCNHLTGVYSDTTQLNSTQLNSTDPVEQRTAKSVVFLFMTSRPTN